MEVVRVFNNELSSLYEVKPPISKAKMTQITKSAIKGIKFYKHIVQSVEKFIQKCRPEYKVPGLYVVDSIVRQSRHQFGPDKDVFGPRFVKNITATFQHLFKCAEDDRPKIIRVLNLWQKNSVFPIDVIQPLLDMGHPNTSNEWPLDASADTSKESPVNKNKEESRHKSSDSWKGWPQNEDPVQDNKTYAEMSTKNLEKFNKAEMSNMAKDDDASRSAMYKNQVKLEKTPEETVKFNKKLLDFDYGDEDEEEEIKNEDNKIVPDSNALALSMAQNLLSNPELLRQLQQMTASTIQQSDTLKDMTMQSLPPQVDDSEASYPQDMQNSPQLSLIPPTSYQQPMSHNMHLSKSETDTDDRILPEPPLPSRDLDERSLASVMASHDRLLSSMCLPAFQQTGVTPKPPLPDKDDRIIPDPTLPPRDLDERSLASIIAPPDRAAMPTIPYTENSNLIQFQYDKNGVPFQTQPPIPMMESMNMDAAYAAVMPPDQHLMQNSQDEDERVMYSMPGEPPLPPQDFDERQIMLPVEDRGRKERSRSRSGSRSRGRGNRRRSRSRSPRRKRSRSRSHTRKNRSRSRERERIREKERERERERERRRKGLPPIKKGCVSVCSTTLWLGHVPKSCSEVDINDTFGPFGTILSIDMIPPRGCAYVVMDRRQDGYKALQKLKNLKLQGSNIKMAWAPGKGVKGKEYKDYWEVDLGVSYVPYEKIKEDTDILDLLEEGGFIDEDSLPEHIKALRKQPDDEKHSYNASNKAISEGNTHFSDIQATPNMVPPPIMPPSSVNIPMVLPHLMQPQFGLHIPGMLPPQAMVMQVPMGIPPPTPMLMVQQQSQSMLSNQPLSMVGGVPQMVPRTIPSATTALSNLKNASQTEPILQSVTGPSTTNVGDATPTEEDGTNVSSPSIQMSISGTSQPVSSTQPVVSIAQFNPILGLNASRPMLNVPPPVSTTGTPIPYPPPNMSFNFPPPGIRPGQGHNIPPNPQFSWMQKQVGSPFTDADSSQSASSTPIRPPPQPGMAIHMYGNRPPFHDPQTSVSNVNSSPMKEPLKGRDNAERKHGDVEGNRNVSPAHHEKMIQEMVISTDDESSMDIEYPRNDMPTGPCFPEFCRAPMNMQRMRGPPGPMPPGPRFRGMPIGSPFPMRMGGPRGMGGPGMHNRMDMEFSPHHGARGPRMPMGPHGPRRNDNMHPPHDGRDWYPRDYDGPPYERERDRRYRDDWGREPWEVEGDSRRNSRDRDEGRREDHREPWNRDRSDNSRPPRDGNDKSDSSGRQREKPPNKGKVNKGLMNDLLKLKSYQRAGSSTYNKTNRNEQSKDKPVQKDDKEDMDQIEKSSDIILEQTNIDKELGNELSVISRREKEREYRKRSRWGRTLSEEREFQQQKRNEIEMKFQSYELSHAAQQPSTADIPVQGSDATPKDELVEDVVGVSTSSLDIPMHSTVDSSMQNTVDLPEQTSEKTSAEMENTAVHHNSEIPTAVQHNSEIPTAVQHNSETPTAVQHNSETPTAVQHNSETPTAVQHNSETPTAVQHNSETPTSVQHNSETPTSVQHNSEIFTAVHHNSEIPVQNSSEELHVLTDSKISTDFANEVTQSESFNSCEVTDNVSFETGVTENNTSSCSESVSDLNVNSDVINSTSNENSVVPDDVITNNSSLVSTES